MSWLAKAGVLFLALTSSNAAGNGDGTAPEVLGDVEYGQYLSSECVTCHNVKASGDNIPSLNGRPPRQLVEIMKAYKAKKLNNPTMQTVASRLDAEQIASLALYFATLEKPK